MSGIFPLMITFSTQCFMSFVTTSMALTMQISTIFSMLRRVVVLFISFWGESSGLIQPMIVLKHQFSFFLIYMFSWITYFRYRMSAVNFLCVASHCQNISAYLTRAYSFYIFFSIVYAVGSSDSESPFFRNVKNVGITRTGEGL